MGGWELKLPCAEMNVDLWFSLLGFMEDLSLLVSRGLKQMEAR